MIRMEIALFLVLTLVASVYFSAGKKPGNLHRAFSALLILTMINLVFDGLTVHTVNRLDVFPIFHTARLGQKIRRSPLSSLCGVALEHITLFPINQEKSGSILLKGLEKDGLFVVR